MGFFKEIFRPEHNKRVAEEILAAQEKGDDTTADALLEATAEHAEPIAAEEAPGEVAAVDAGPGYKMGVIDEVTPETAQPAAEEVKEDVA